MAKTMTNINRKAIIILMIFFTIMLTCFSSEGLAQTKREKRMQNSLQYKDKKFKNPVYAPIMAPGSTWKYIKKLSFNKRIDPKPAIEIPVTPVQKKDWLKTDEKDLLFAWLGHSSILIALDGKTILVDPVLEKRASPVSWIGPKRFHPAPVTAKELPPIDIVLITHDHYDHLEKPTIKTLESKTSLFLVPLGIGRLLEKWGIEPQKIVELDWWENHKVDSLTITATPAVHYAKRGLFDGDTRLWCSWSVNGKNNKVFISGDSGYFDGFKKVGKNLGPFDVTFLKIGAYDELWKQIHMNPEEAVQQHRDLGGKALLPLHWATFDLALHPWYEPMERVLLASQQQNVHVITPIIGEQINFKSLPLENPWWRKGKKEN